MLVLSGCRNGNIKKVDPPPPEPRCGDGDISLVEECEGSNLNAATCKSLGFDDGVYIIGLYMAIFGDAR